MIDVEYRAIRDVCDYSERAPLSGSRFSEVGSGQRGGIADLLVHL